MCLMIPSTSFRTGQVVGLQEELSRQNWNTYCRAATFNSEARFIQWHLWIFLRLVVLIQISDFIFLPLISNQNIPFVN